MRQALSALIVQEEAAALDFAVNHIMVPDQGAGDHGFKGTYEDLIRYCSVNGLTIGSTDRARALDLLEKLAKKS